MQAGRSVVFSGWLGMLAAANQCKEARETAEQILECLSLGVKDQAIDLARIIHCCRAHERKGLTIAWQ